MVHESIVSYVERILEEHDRPVVRVSLPKRVYIGFNMALIKAFQELGFDGVYAYFREPHLELPAVFREYSVDTERLSFIGIGDSMADEWSRVGTEDVAEVADVVAETTGDRFIFIDGIDGLFTVFPGYAEELCRRLAESESDGRTVILYNVPAESRAVVGDELLEPDEVIEPGGVASGFIPRS